MAVGDAIIPPRRRPSGFLGKALDRLEEFTGLTIVDTDHLRVTEAVSREAVVMANDLSELGWVSMNYVHGRPADPTALTRRRWAQQCRVVWLADPQAGASVEMLNEFTFSRGVPRPRAKDKEVQKLLDEAWDDPQNQRVLTSYVAQLKLGNSLSVQSNVFYLMFDDGEDGRVRLSFLNHDTVGNAFTDPINRQRVLYFLATKYQEKWDFDTDRPIATPQTLPKPFYYEAWDGPREALEDRGMDEDQAKEALDQLRKAAAAGDAAKDKPLVVNEGQDDELKLPPPSRIGAGKVYHLADGNLDMEMIFAVPRMRRTIRWYTAYNDYMKARVDMMMAASSFIMEKQITAGPGMLEKLAGRSMRGISDLRAAAESATLGPGEVKQGPRPASVIDTSGAMKFAPFNLNSGAGNAETDAQMLRAQVSAGDRFPQHYLGDVGSANLATATSMELPVLKHVEARMELVEGLFRWFLDRVIERAIETNKLDPNQPGEQDEPEETLTPAAQQVVEGAISETTGPVSWRINGKDELRETRAVLKADGSIEFFLLEEAHEDKADDEADTGRDLSYEFGMPSPLRRMMTDFVASAVQVAQMADPNGLNVELTRTLLTLVLAEAFEIPDAADVVDRIFPKGYNPMAMLQQMQGGPPGGPQAGPPPGNFFSPAASDQPSDPANAYGAPATATPPEKVPGVQESAAPPELMEGPVIMLGRNGQPVIAPGVQRQKSGGEPPVGLSARARGRSSELETQFDRDVRAGSVKALAALDMNRIGSKDDMNRFGDNNGKGD